MTPDKGEVKSPPPLRDKSPLPSGERARVRGMSLFCVTFEFGKNHGQDAVQILQHIRIPESQDSIAFARKISVTAPVARTVRVLAAVDLNHKGLFLAEKVDNPRPNRHLAAKLPSSEAAVAKLVPQLAFGDGRVTPQSARFKGTCLFHHSPLTPTLSPRGEGEEAGPPHQTCCSARKDKPLGPSPQPSPLRAEGEFCMGTSDA